MRGDSRRLGRSAYPEALRHARRVLELLERVGDARQRARLELEARRAQVVAAATTWDWQDPATHDNCLRLRALGLETATPRAWPRPSSTCTTTPWPAAT